MSSVTAVQINALATSLHSIGMDVPDVLRTEIELAASLRQYENDRANRNAEASRAMTQAKTPAEFEKAWDAASKILASDAAKFDPGFRGITTAIIGSRAQQALGKAIPELQAKLVDSMNSVVDTFGLNDSAKSLPEFGEPFFQPVGMSPGQMDAFKDWNDGSAKLTPLWKVFVRVANLSGHTLGSTSEPSANIRLCYVLADVIEQDPLTSMADTVASWKAGSNSAKRYGNLFPFLIPPSHGVPLKFRTTFEAEALAEAIPYADQR